MTRTRETSFRLQRLAGVLMAEPRWLRGLDWRLVGMASALAIAFTAALAMGWINPRRDDWSNVKAKVLIVLTFNAIAGLSILLMATVLTNLRNLRLPLSLILAIAVVVGPLTGHLFMVSQNFNDQPERFSTWSGMAIFVLVRALLITLPWSVAAAAWYFHQRSSLRASALRAAELDRRRLETGMMEARLQALQAQVEPHFLFNTLAHVKRLYRTDPARARKMLASFRAHLHSALPQMRGRGTTLGREIELVRAYLDVQQVRMGRRLQVHVEAPTVLRAHPFPPMMLISLVENAIKHGLNPVPQGGAITISATRSGSVLAVTVADTGRGIDDQLGSGVGLSNIRDRLAALFGSSAGLSLTPQSPHGVLATIEIPLMERGVDVDGGATPSDVSRAIAA